MTIRHTPLISLAASLAFVSTTAFGQSYQTLSNSLGSITVNTAYGSQNQPSLRVLPTYGVELTDNLSFGFPPNADVNTATATSDGKLALFNAHGGIV